MSVWVSAAVAVAVLGLAVLALLSWRLWTQVRVLGRAVSTAGERVAAAQEELSRIGRQRVPNQPWDVH